MNNFFSFKQAISQIGTIRIMDILDIVLVAVLIYFVISLIRRAQTFKVFMGVVVILLTLWISGEMQLYTVRSSVISSLSRRQTPARQYSSRRLL